MNKLNKYQDLYDHLDKKIPGQVHDGHFTHTRTFCRGRAINFHYFRHRLQELGASCDKDVQEIIRLKMPGTSPIVDMPRKIDSMPKRDWTQLDNRIEQKLGQEDLAG